MRTKKTITSILSVTLSNLLTLVSGIFVGLLLPKIITVGDYGLYKTFTLYLTYAGFFSLGIIDGIVLDYGGYNLDQLDRPSFRSYFKWYAIIHSFFFGIIIVISLFFDNADYKFICIMLAVSMVANNFTGYFQQISQFTERFGEYSIRKIIQSGINIVAILALYMIKQNGGNIDYKLYVIVFALTNVVLMCWYLITYRDIWVGKAAPIRATGIQIKHLMLIGFPLLFANLCSTLILTLDRQFVNVLFDNDTYAIYAFAYNLLSLVTVATSAVSTVLYPLLKRTSEDVLKENYQLISRLVLITIFLAISAYFPLCILIDSFLPKYHDSLQIFRIIFPGLAISTSVTVVMHNYYKTLGKNLIYFKKSIVVLLISAFANIVAYYGFHTTQAISIASIVTMVIWYCTSEQYFVKAYSIKRARTLSYLLTMMCLFYIVSLLGNPILGFIIYLAIWIIVSMLFFMGKVDMKQVKKLINR